MNRIFLFLIAFLVCTVINAQSKSTCSHCGGTGQCSCYGGVSQEECNLCGGSGSCSYCHGSGVIYGDLLDATIEAIRKKPSRNSASTEYYITVDGIKYKRNEEQAYSTVGIAKLNQGKHTVIYPNGGKFVGTFKKGKKNGFGRYEGDGVVVEGVYLNDRLNGKGKITYSNGDYYEGDFKNGERHGNGIDVEGYDKYIGEYKNDKKCGRGTLTNASGDKFVGLFDSDSPSNGTYLFTNGDKYEGTISGTGFDGGIYTFADGRIYEGEYLHIYPNGRGALTYPNGDKFIGYISEGKPYKEGLYTWANGNMYKGHFYKGLKSGNGKMYYNNNTYEEGVWNNDIMIKKTKSGKWEFKGFLGIVEY